jgi:hypothetical protein
MILADEKKLNQQIHDKDFGGCLRLDGAGT